MKKMHSKYLKSLLILFLTLSGASVFAQLNTPKAKLDSARILIGDQIKFQLEILKKKNSKVFFPELRDTLVEGVEILEQSKIDTVIINNDMERLIQEFLITSFDSGYYEIPALRFYIEEEGSSNSYFSRPQYFQVMTLSLDSGENAIFDIKPPIQAPVTFKEVAPWLFSIVFGGMILGFLLHYLMQRSKNKPVFKREKPKEPAHLIAFRDLEKLKDLELWQQDKIKEYYTELTDIFRIYLENKYNVQAMEETSHEIMIEMDKLQIPETIKIEKIREVLLNSDLVKFAKSKPTADENEISYNVIYLFVEQTKNLLTNNVNKAQSDNTEMQGSDINNEVTETEKQIDSIDNSKEV